MSENTVPALAVAKEQAGDEVVTLSTGVRVRFNAVNPATMAEVVARVPEPTVPMWHNEKKGRDEPNPNDPSYLRAVERADEARGVAMMDAMALFGFELVDGIPDDNWLKELRLLEKLGHIDLSAFDIDDDIDREFLYRKHVAMGTDDWTILLQRIGITPEGVARAEDSFPGNA
jgi:hypothetical protein